jgi:hypothetical protein
MVTRIIPDVSFVEESFIAGNREKNLGWNMPDGFHSVHLLSRKKEKHLFKRF